MRVVSLLPSATEMVHFAGAGDALVGVTHECDFPPGVEKLPKLTSSKIEPGLSSAEIDAAVGRLTDSGSIYALDSGLLEELSPDLVITQGLCDVCAVSMNVVKKAVTGLKTQPEILSLDPSSLHEVLEDVVMVGDAVGRSEETREKAARLKERLARIEKAVDGLPRPRVGCIEWLDPPFTAGHWVPEMVRIAGGEEVLANPGESSARLAWDEVYEAAPEVLILMPCGFDVRRTVEEAYLLPAVKSERVWAVDANSYFSRPAPRLVEGVEILARVLHPETFSGPPEPAAAVSLSGAAL